MRFPRSGLLIVASLLATNAGCGGCPWVTTSDAEVSDNAACLDLDVADGSGDEPSTGCVDPVVFGTNNCNAELIVPAEFSATGQELVIAPGGAVAIEVPLSVGEYDEDEERYTFLLAAELGDEPISITFTADAP
jgi:hypothetical protein